MPPLPRSPLLVAVVLAAIPATALAVMLGPARHRATPPTSITAPTPTPSPHATPLPSLVVADSFDLGAPRSLGRIDVVGYDHAGQVDITGYTLAATAPAAPPSLPVWTLRGFANVSTTALEARFGVAPPAPQFPGDKQDGLVDVARAQVSAGSGSTTTLLNAGTQPHDAETAAGAAARVLADAGLLPQDADPSAGPIDDSASVVTWRVTYARHPIDGVPVGFGFDDTVAEVQITELGNVTRLIVDDPAVDGGAQYPLRSVAQAWAEVRAGHWFDECCQVFTGAAPGPSKVAFRADTVSLVYEAAGIPARFLVPMYVFTDSRDQLALSVPALQPADLAEPGGFRLTQPGGG